MIIEKKVRKILKDFYKHITGVDDFGCKKCEMTVGLLTKLLEDSRIFHGSNCIYKDLGTCPLQEKNT